jgi:hypothetical protein
MAEEPNKVQKAVGVGCLSLIVLGLVVVVLGAALGGGDSELETTALDVVDQTFGECLVASGLDDWRESAVVRTSTETDGVVTVAVFATRIATGEELRYEFRVNTGLGSYTGIPNPGTAIPIGADAERLRAAC